MFRISFTLILFFSLVCAQLTTNAQELKRFHGYVYNDIAEALPFVNIYIKGSTRGTTSNFEGEFTLEIPNNKDIEVVFQYVGFKKHSVLVKTNENPSPITVKLEIENIMLREVVITTRKEDPAYPIIRHAIANRKFHYDKVHSFSSQVYMKGNVKLDEIPTSFFLIPKSEMPDSTQLGLVYLSESVSNYYFEKPNRQKEEMIASKISGTKTGYSFNRTEMVLLSFYKNLVGIGLSERSFISPIANNALFYYNYELIETFSDNEELVHKIKVIPKRKHDNVFKGYIYIVENKWNIHSLDLTITRNSQIDFTDSVYIRQVHVPVTKDIRMPLSLHIVMYFKAFGFKATANFIGFFSDYKVNVDFPKNTFGSEVFAVKVDEDIQEKNYWDENRQSILTDEEKDNYRKGDSLIAYHESDKYLDSVMRVGNKFKLKKLLFSGYSIRDKHRTIYYRLHPLTEALATYNTIEGFNMNLKQHFSKTWKNQESLSFNLFTKYSFTNQNLLFSQNINYYFDKLHRQVIRLTFGKYNYDYNDNNPISPMQNMMRSFMVEDNFLKLYRKEFVKLESSREIVNGLEAKVFGEYAYRSSLTNHENFSIVDVEDKEFTSNNPLSPDDDTPVVFENPKALSVGFELVFKFKQKYATYPKFRERYGTKYPIIKLSYEKGVKTSFSDVDYDQWKIGIYDKLNFKNIGVSNVALEFGGFWNNSSMEFMDYKHFHANQTLIIPQNDEEVELGASEDGPKSEVKPVTFHSMEYYTKSTNTSFFAMNYEHHFNGWIINKFPLLRKTKIQMLAGINFLKTPENEHTEFYMGFEHIFKVLRVDFVGVSEGGGLVTKVKIGIGF